MSEAIGIRLDEHFLKNLDKMSREETLDRSAMLRKLLNLGFFDFMKQKAKQKYLEGKITLSEAAKMSNATVWEMKNYLVSCGYKSAYSIEDLEEDMKKLSKLGSFERK